MVRRALDHALQRVRRSKSLVEATPIFLPSTTRTLTWVLVLGHVLVDVGSWRSGSTGWPGRRRPLRSRRPREYPSTCARSAALLVRLARFYSLGWGLGSGVGDETALTPIPYTTPTRTLRKRAGAAPWPTCATCIGSPLPQLGTPQSVPALGSADGVARAPEVRRDAGVGGVLQHRRACRS